MKSKIVKKISCAILAFLCLSCSDFIVVDSPKTELVKATVFENDDTANAAVLGLYNQMRTSGFASGDLMSVSFVCGLASDELLSYSINPSISQELEQFNKNNLISANTIVESLWNQSYNFVYQSNAILEGLENESSKVSEEMQSQLTGEAKFIRAFCHFYLVNLFGDVPLVLTTHWDENKKIQRTPSDIVYEQIITDLQESIAILGDNYSHSNDEKVRINKKASQALLARVYLFTNNWISAEQEATHIIDSGIYNLETFENSFLKNNNEAIWQLSSDYGNSSEAYTYFSSGLPANAAFTSELWAAFEIEDQRKTHWVNSSTDGTSQYYFPYKYKAITPQPITEYTTILRLAELYLIRAEARSEQEKLTEALQDVNAIRARAGLIALGSLSKDQLIEAILQEKRIEFFTEWGHRWLDLKRKNVVDDYMQVVKPNSWQTAAQLFPIPESQLTNSASTSNSQNPGY